MITFTIREMKNAWRENRKAGSVDDKNNANRLLLFYAVECGLKALILKRKSLELTCDSTEISEAGHNINKLLDHLRAGYALKLKPDLSLKPIKKDNNQHERNCTIAELNQIWRYGGRCSNIPDHDLQNGLEKINRWIGEQL